jgi:hypothetical protein
MAKHLLSLDIPDVNNPYYFSVNDQSVYAAGLGVTCGELLITPPGFNNPVTFQVDQGFTKNLSACDLQVQFGGCGTTYSPLPDGIYDVRYMVAPLGIVFVEYNYLRLTNINNFYYNRLAQLEIALTDPDQVILDTLAEMRFIRSLLDAAKAKVEILHDAAGGMDMFAYAKKRLARLANTCY